MAEYDSVIPAGGSGTLTAKVKTASGQNRRFSKSITVVTDATVANTLILRFSVEAYSPIVVLPSYRMNLTTTAGKPGRTAVLLHRADGKKLAVHEIEAEHSDILVRARAVSDNLGGPAESDGETGLWPEVPPRRRPIEAAPGDVWIELSTKEAPPGGYMAGELHLKTNDPEAPELSIPYVVRVRPVIDVHPKAIRMWLSPVRGSEGRSAIVSLRHNRGGEFAITGVEASHPEIFSGAANSTGSSSRQAIRISVTEGLTADDLAGSLEGFIVVATNDPDHPKVEIPVVVSPTRSLSRRPVPTRPSPTR